MPAMIPIRRSGLRAALALLALSALLFGAFLWPLPAHLASGVAYTAHAAEGTPPRMLVQGDHLQLQYHFDLVHEMVAGRIRAFTNPYEFAVDPATPAPRRVDAFYFPFSLPYALLRFALPDALCWNLAQLLSVFLGLWFCFLLARRFGVGPVAAFTIAALANCVPYRWVVLAGGSPTGVGMGLVPGVALGADMAVRDRSVRGGALAGALLFCLYAADLHCFLFAGLALPLWGVLSLLRSERGLRRPFGLVAPLAPIALGVALAGVLAFFAKQGYEGTDAAAGRTLRELERHSPDWHAFFDPGFFSHNPDQFYMGVVLAGCLLLAGLVVLLGCVRSFTGSQVRQSNPSTPSTPSTPQLYPVPFTLSTLLSGLLLGAAILFVFFLALGTHGPLEALPLRAFRKLVPPFRMVRQPLKAFCLLPTLYAAFFAVAWSCRPRLRFSKGTLAPAVAIVLLAFLSGHRGMRAGICLEPGADAAWLAVAEDAKSRDIEPRALVLPIWPGDSSWSSVYQYHAVRAGVPMLNGYAAVRSHDYAERVFHRFETMTEGDFTDDQAAGLRELGVTHVLLHENAFPAKVSLFPFGETLRRHLADPRLRLLAAGDGVWAFAVGNLDVARHSSPVTRHWSPAATARHWRLDPPGTNAAVKLRSFAQIHREGYGWLARAEADKDLLLVTSVPGSADPATTNRFPAVDGAAPGSWRLAFAPAPFPGTNLWTALETPGSARISDLAFAEAPKTCEPDPWWPAGGLYIGASALVHEFGRTEPLEAHTLGFDPAQAPPCVAVEGPGLPLPLSPGRYRAEIVWRRNDGYPPSGESSPFRFDEDANLGARPLPGDPAALEFDYDGTSFAGFRVLYDGSRPAWLDGIRIAPAE